MPDDFEIQDKICLHGEMTAVRISGIPGLIVTGWWKMQFLLARDGSILPCIFAPLWAISSQDFQFADRQEAATAAEAWYRENSRRHGEWEPRKYQRPVES